MNGHNAPSSKPHLEITEQPAPKALRFRYECEGRSAGSIPGEHSTPDNRTYPTVRVVGFSGKEDIVIVVSCVTKNEPHLAHPHNLVGKDCREGICSINLDKETMTAVFSNLGIQCVKKRDIEAALRLRQSRQVDPFGRGFDHANNPSSIDLNCVRLCFQAIIKFSSTKHVLLDRAVSNPVYDKKAMSDLLITRLSHASAPARGGTEMMLLCEKITKEDIKVRFYEEVQEQEVWEGFADISLVHKQVAIAFKTPAYTLEVREKIPVYIQLYRPSDRATSEPVRFLFTDSGFSIGNKRPLKRPRPEGNADDIANLRSNMKSLMNQPTPGRSPNHRPETMDLNTLFDLILERSSSPEYGMSPSQASCPGQLAPVLYDIRPSTPQFSIKTEPNSSPSSPYHNPHYSRSVTPVPSDAGPSIYVPVQAVASPSTLPPFSVLQPTTEYRMSGNSGGGTFTVQQQQQQQSYPISQASLVESFHRWENDLRRQHYANQSSAVNEPINAYGNVLTPINNEEVPCNNEASIEHMVDSGDLVRTFTSVASNAAANYQNEARHGDLVGPFTPVASTSTASYQTETTQRSDVVGPFTPVASTSTASYQTETTRRSDLVVAAASHQTQAQQLCESFSNSMNISGDINVPSAEVDQILRDKVREYFP